MARIDHDAATTTGDSGSGGGSDHGGSSLDRRRMIQTAGAWALVGSGAVVLGQSAALAQESEAPPAAESERRRDRAARQASGADQEQAPEGDQAEAIAATDPAAAEADIEALNLALSVEQLSVAVLAGGMQTFDGAAFAAFGLAETAFVDIAAMLDQDETHSKRLTKEIGDLGGSVVEPTSYTPASVDPVGFLQLAAALKETAVAAYATVAQSLTDRGQRETILGIHSVEARHAALLQVMLAAPAFPEAIDRPLAAEEVALALASIATGAIPPSPTERPRVVQEEEPASANDESAAVATPATETPTATTREPRRVQDPAAEAGANGNVDDVAPPFQEIPIEGSTGGLDLPATTPTAAADPAPSEPLEEGTTNQERFALVLADAATQLGVDPAAVTIVTSEKTEWPDASLGCPEEGGLYAQVITPGFRVVVEGAGSQLEYHTDRRAETFVLCSDV